MRGKTFVGCVLGEFIWLRISLKTNPEGCLPPAQPAFNLFLSPAKACPFKVPAVLSAVSQNRKHKRANRLEPQALETQLATQDAASAALSSNWTLCNQMSLSSGSEQQ